MTAPDARAMAMAALAAIDVAIGDADEAHPERVSLAALGPALSDLIRATRALLASPPAPAAPNVTPCGDPDCLCGISPEVHVDAKPDPATVKDSLGVEVAPDRDPNSTEPSPIDPRTLPQAERLLRSACERLTGTPVAEQSPELGDISFAIDASIARLTAPPALSDDVREAAEEYRLLKDEAESCLCIGDESCHHEILQREMAMSFADVVLAALDKRRRVAGGKG